MTNDGIWRVAVLTVALPSAVAILIGGNTDQPEQRQHKIKIQIEMQYDKQ